MLTATALQAKRERKAHRRLALRHQRRKLLHRFGERLGEQVYRTIRDGALDDEMQKQLSLEAPRSPHRAHTLPCMQTTGDIHRARRRARQA